MADAIFKKREGILSLSSNSKILSWTPKLPPKAPPELTVLVADITNLQQTPPDKPKVMMKVFAKSDKSVEPLVHIFTFSSPDQARAQADHLKNSLGIAIQAAKATSNGALIGSQEGQPPGLAIAKAVSKPGSKDDSIYSDDQLLHNIELQIALCTANANLNRTMTEARTAKPETMSNAQFNKQFWSSRLGLLRAYAIQQSQEVGAYNVLSTIKPTLEDDQTKVSITATQIVALLRQYPVLARAYDENVPKIENALFWKRFFQSRLLKKLKGERITDADAKDAIFDKYLTQEDDARLQQRILATHIPHTIDLQGNEDNHSQRKGNAPDPPMRPKAVDKVPIIRTLNSMSERLMAGVVPNDIDPSEPIGVDEETFNQLALRDLQADSVENRLILSVKDQGRFFSSGKDNQADLNLLTSTQTTPQELLQRLQDSLTLEPIGLSTHDLTMSLGLDPDSDPDSDDEAKIESTHFSSHRALRDASKQAFGLIAEQRTQNEDVGSSGFSSANAPLALLVPKSGLSADILDRLSLTHATTIEFLNYFWSTFLSGDPARADEIASLSVTLDRAKHRIDAVAQEAEYERAGEVGKLKKAAIERGRRMGKPPVNIDESAVKGGKKAVIRLMEPTVGAINRALKKYEEAKVLAGLDNGTS